MSLQDLQAHKDEAAEERNVQGGARLSHVQIQHGMDSFVVVLQCKLRNVPVRAMEHTKGLLVQRAQCNNAIPHSILIHGNKKEMAREQVGAEL